ncbi:MAG TPA: hypothetical protein VGK46_04695 [Saprospiraceae bacterium]
MYTIICNCCGRDACKGEEHSCWSDPDFVADGAKESGWHIEDKDDKHYCPDCFTWDDNDNLVIKKRQ